MQYPFKCLASLATVALVVFASGPVMAADDHGHAPKNGGIVVPTKAGDFEIVAQPELLQVYFTDHGKALQLEGAKAKITLLNGAEKSEAELLPAGNKMEARGSFKVAKGTKGVVVLTLVGKPPATARFAVK